MSGHQLLDRSKSSATEFGGNGIGPSHIRIGHSHQPDGFALLRQLVIDAGVIAPKSAGADNRDVNKAIGQLALQFLFTKAGLRKTNPPSSFGSQLYRPGICLLPAPKQIPRATCRASE